MRLLSCILIIIVVISQLQVSWSDTPDQEFSKWKLVGCFPTTVRQPVLGHQVTTADSRKFMSHSVCQITCRKRYLKYFGLYRGSECYCGNSKLYLDSPLPKAELCRSTCSGNNDEFCGGKAAMLVFETFSKPMLTCHDKRLLDRC
ncbi:hypothetical protein BOX15_Mlig027532g1 [Macrostomum lignano]|uniref:WSC domain-containing protein n=1 Tax=Macrostomum lignano TaxID=282301 RepID=A0A267GZS7_9PLAT|nr:hypothetical protein BOX15_Mlig001137g5 [Macrostomum lignano]PAA49032.1 hypothetical protein BOX15_Mlig001137g4 [Macrostomum lignano]PAA63008.1 hypothetical protein BOX15_Mlig001137g2 [Macrostomum lignano]PAA91551.1 hypothetical protein BOX15_Mlig027532g1 [Macrostomum lignano]